MAEISNTTPKKLVTGTSEADSIDNYYKGNNVTIDGGAGNDEIYNDGSNVSINGGTGDDYVYNNEGYDVIIKGGNGNDSIENGGDESFVDGGAGDDSIKNYGWNVTTDAGDGNDSIGNGGNNASINGGNGNDSILNWEDNVTIDGGAGDDYIDSYSYYLTISGGAGNDEIYNDGSNVTIDGGEGNDTISLASDSEFNLITYRAGDGNDIVYGFNGDSTLSITGSTCSTLLSGDDVVVTVGDGKITLAGAAKLATLNVAGTLIDTEGKIIINKQSGKVISGTRCDDTIYNYASKVTINAGEDDDYLSTLRKTSNVKLYGDAGDDTIEAYNATKALLDGGAGDDEIYSSGKQNTIVGGTGNDTIEIDSANTQIQYAAGDGNDVIEGFNETSTLKIGDGTGIYSSQTSGSDIIVKVGEGSVILNGAADLETLHIAGTCNALLVTVSSVTLGTNIAIADATARTKATRIVGNTLDNTILGGKGKDSLYGKDGDDTIDGGAGNDYLSGGNGADSISGGAGSDKLYGGNGADTLWGGAGNDTLYGGAGGDLFVYSGGKDVITDYADGDQISLGAAVSDASIKGSNVILKVGTGTLTIKDAKYKELSFIDSSGNGYAATYGKIAFDNSHSSNQTLTTDIETADASARTKAIQIFGNALNNSIVGGAGNDTLWGCAGNDTLRGGEGSDTFIYNNGEGKDVIADFDEDDLLQITGKFTGSYNAGTDVITFKVGSTASAITLKNFSTETFNINGDNYVISGNKLVKQ